MSELKSSHPNDPNTKKSSYAPRSTKTSRAREVYLQKQAVALSTPSTASTSTAASITPKTVKPKSFKASTTPVNYIQKNITTKPVALKSVLKPTPESIKEVKNELKLINQTPGDVADEDFEIVQINEIKENQSAINSPHPDEDTPRDTEPPQPAEQCTPTTIMEASQTSHQAIEINVQAEEDKRVDISEPNNIPIENVPCESFAEKVIIDELQSKLSEKEKDIEKLEISLKDALNDLKRVEDGYNIRLKDLNKKLEESENRLRKSIEECNQHKNWVDSAECQLNTMKLKYFESEQKLLAQEDDLKRLLRWSNIKNASIITFAASAIAYYQIRK